MSSTPTSDVPELIHETFGARIDATQPIVVERSVYSNRQRHRLGRRHERDGHSPSP